MSLTTDRNDPDLGYGVDSVEVPQNKKYLVLSKEEIDKGFVQPLRDSYWHNQCGTITKMASAIAETYARDPKFYGATYCCGCHKHLPLFEFAWVEADGTISTQYMDMDYEQGEEN